MCSILTKLVEKRPQKINQNQPRSSSPHNPQPTHPQFFTTPSHLATTPPPHSQLPLYTICMGYVPTGLDHKELNCSNQAPSHHHHHHYPLFQTPNPPPHPSPIFPIWDNPPKILHVNLVPFPRVKWCPLINPQSIAPLSGLHQLSTSLATSPPLSPRLQQHVTVVSGHNTTSIVEIRALKVFHPTTPLSFNSHRPNLSPFIQTPTIDL